MRLTRSTARISNLIFLSPFLSLFFIRAFVGEEILLSTWIGLGLIVAGLLLQRSFKQTD
jgi:drug/metabolite transporter (DMT)-like permease